MRSGHRRLALIRSKYSCVGADTTNVRIAPPHRRALRRVLDKMNAEVAGDLDLNTLAAESGYSRSHLLRVFRTGMGCSPHQWLTQLRVGHAKAMLRGSSCSLIDIAAACGFSSHSHFSKVFRHLVGMPPSQYRRLR
jgi:AraC family transcriptional regulator